MPRTLEPCPIVVYGAARSGTTYLIQILNRHPEVFISNETRIFVWLHQSLKVLPQQESIFYRERELFLGYLRETYPELVRNFYRRLAPEQVRWWGDKNPHYVSPENRGCLETILELFPEARFIHIIRDGRDVVMSGLRGRWRDFERVHYMWKSHVDIGWGFGRSLPADRYFELRYEDLVADDVAMARKLFDFLGIALHPAVIRFCEAQMEKRTPFCDPSRNLSEGAAASDWATVLTREQQQRSLGLLADHLVKYGYESMERVARLREAPVDG
jgi:hypothetical protein